MRYSVTYDDNDDDDDDVILIDLLFSLSSF